MTTQLRSGGWLLVLALLVVATGQFDHDLWTPDEPRVAAISAEMGARGDYVVPHLAGEPFIEKPPIYFAMAAVFGRLGVVLGEVNALRLLNVVLALATLGAAWLLARRLCGPEVALWTVITLGMMEGFVANTHWLRVDNALAMFSAAAVWAFAEGYLGGRRGMVAAGAAFTAGAFLSKGFIGPAVVFFPWLALFVTAIVRHRRDGTGWGRFVGIHGAALCCFLIPAAGWMAMLRFGPGGERLWQEWFWENHFGRVMGTSLPGHVKKGEHLYYLQNLVESTLPWAPLIGVWLWHEIRRLARTRASTTATAVAGVWAVGTLTLLTLSGTKRGLYLSPTLPAFALMAAVTLHRGVPKWVRYYALSWAGLCAVLALALGLCPLYARALAGGVPGEIADYLSAVRYGQPVALVAGAVTIWMAVRPATRSDPGTILAGSTGLLWIALVAVAVPAINQSKSMGAETRRFVDQVPAELRGGIAGWRLSETERGLLSFYGRWAVPRVLDEDRVLRVLRGRDPDYDSLVVARDGPGDILASTGIAGAPPYRVLAEAHPRSDKIREGLYWIRGDSGPVGTGRR